MYADPAGYVVVVDSDIVKIVVALLQGALTLQQCVFQIFLLYIHTLLSILLRERERERERERLATRERERERDRKREREKETGREREIYRVRHSCGAKNHSSTP